MTKVMMAMITMTVITKMMTTTMVTIPTMVAGNLMARTIDDVGSA